MVSGLIVMAILLGNQGGTDTGHLGWGGFKSVRKRACVNIGHIHGWEPRPEQLGSHPGALP